MWFLYLMPFNTISRLSRICACLTSLINLVWVSIHHLDTFYSRNAISILNPLNTHNPIQSKSVTLTIHHTAKRFHAIIDFRLKMTISVKKEISITFVKHKIVTKSIRSYELTFSTTKRFHAITDFRSKMALSVKQARFEVVHRTTWIYKDQDMRDYNEILTNLNMKNGKNTDLNKPALQWFVEHDLLKRFKRK